MRKKFLAWLREKWNIFYYHAVFGPGMGPLYLEVKRVSDLPDSPNKMLTLMGLHKRITNYYALPLAEYFYHRLTPKQVQYQVNLVNLYQSLTDFYRECYYEMINPNNHESTTPTSPLPEAS